MGLLFNVDLSEENEGKAALYIGISIGLTLLAGLMSGLTLGLMSMDHVDLQARSDFSSLKDPETLDAVLCLARLSCCSCVFRYPIERVQGAFAGIGAQWNGKGKEACRKSSSGANGICCIPITLLAVGSIP